MLSIYAHRLSIRLRDNSIGYRVELNVTFVTGFLVVHQLPQNQQLQM